MRDTLYWALLAALFGVAFTALAVFVARPDIDLAVAALFYAPGEGFPLAADRTVDTLRDAYAWLFYAACAVATLGLLGCLLRVENLRTPARVWVFLVALAALGPGVMANTIFKENWGRARPAHVVEFGGQSAHTPPFAFGESCARNCSFVSGEVAMAASLAVGALAVFGWMLGSAATRLSAAAAASAFVAGEAYVRMAAGRHFLSDALFAALLTALIAMALYALCDVGAARRGLRPQHLVGDAAATLRGGWRAASRVVGRLTGRKRASAD
jgi:membrane-associated PAP2 superfamily phosphatase